jgi:hypothetical protein
MINLIKQIAGIIILTALCYIGIIALFSIYNCNYVKEIAVAGLAIITSSLLIYNLKDKK